MIGWLLERIFMDRKGRESRNKVRRLKESPAGELAAKQEAEPDDGNLVEEGASTDPEREQLINEAMTIFRQRRAEFDKLDGATRERISKAASEAFGDGEK